MQHLEVHICDLSNKTKIKLIEMITEKKKKKEAHKQGSRHILLLYRSALAYYDAS